MIPECFHILMSGLSSLIFMYHGSQYGLLVSARARSKVSPYEAILCGTGASRMIDNLYVYITLLYQTRVEMESSITSLIVFE
jgi:hypothetical protein